MVFTHQLQLIVRPSAHRYSAKGILSLAATTSQRCAVTMPMTEAKEDAIIYANESLPNLNPSQERLCAALNMSVDAAVEMEEGVDNLASWLPLLAAVRRAEALRAQFSALRDEMLRLQSDAAEAAEALMTAVERLRAEVSVQMQ